MNSPPSESRTRLKPIAMPIEHGGWAFLGAPILLGLWVAPSASGWWLGLAALGAFLSRQPLKLAYGDWSRKKRFPRTAWAERFLVFYALIALIGLMMAFVNRRFDFWLPLALAIPLVATQMVFDLRKDSRNLIAEITGVVGIGSIVTAIGLAAGVDLRGALLLWLLLSLHSIPALVYVGTRLRLARGGTDSRWPPILLHVLSLAAVVGFVLTGTCRSLSAICFLVLCIRCWLGLQPFALKAKPIRVGMEELIFTLIWIAGIAHS